MASPFLISALAASLMLPAPIDIGVARNVVAVGGDCSNAARRVVAQTGGELLSAKPDGDSCVVTVLVPGNGNARPRKVTVRVAM